MSSLEIRVFGALIFCGGVLAAMPAAGEDRSAEVILKEIDAVTLPKGDASKEDDPEYVRQFWKRTAELRLRRAELIGELDRVDPDHPRLVKLLPVRWRSFSGRMAGPDSRAEYRDQTAELDEVLARTKSGELKVEIAYIKAWMAGDPLGRPGAARGFEAQMQAVDAFIALAPKDKRGAELLFPFTYIYRDDPARLEGLYARIARDYPESKQAEQARRSLGRAAALGKPFDLTFRDATRGNEVSMRDLRGKVVVVDFWATWCGPCVAEMPRMKELYARYRDKGVEFIGVSLDVPKERGGLDKLKAFVAENEIRWPQYYQGDGWDSEFSKGWEINAVPTVFLVGRDGKLVSLDAGERLEALIVEQLK